MSGRKKEKAAQETIVLAAKLTGLTNDTSAEEFVEYWNLSPTLKGLAAVLGISASTCALYAARLREAGHELKWFRKGRPRLLKM